MNRVESGALSGVAAAVWADGEEPYYGGFGAASATTPISAQTIFWIASMTRAVTAVAAMQLVERKIPTLDESVGSYVPYLAAVQVFDRFETDGTPRLRDSKRPITLRHLLTHTSGFGYDFADASLAQYTAFRQPQTPPSPAADYELPLLFDPGDRWCYGVGIDWCGQVIQAATGQRLDAVFASQIFEPLGMHDTTFTRRPSQRERTADVMLRTPEGLVPIPFELPEDPEFLMAGGGFYSTVADYLRFTRMLLGNGNLEGTTVLTAESVELMARSHTTAAVDGWQAVNPMMTNAVDLTASGPIGGGLSFLINETPTAEGRSPGSLSWAGLANTYYWIDRRRRTTGVFATQVQTFRRFEATVDAVLPVDAV